MMDEKQLELYQSRPVWYMVFYVVAVLSGLFACIALLFKRKSALILSLVSLFSVLITVGYNLTSGAWQIVDFTDKILIIMVPVLAVLLWLFVHTVNQKGWLK